MGFSTEIPNSKGPRDNMGGAVPGPLSRGADPAIPNESGDDRERREGAKAPAEGGFLRPPNENAPNPGYGGKM